MDFRRYGVIMAGGAGERFWPVSTPAKPKQFLHLSDPNKSLLGEAVDRASEFFGASQTLIATGLPWHESSIRECPDLPLKNILAEPAKRNTTGCMIWTVANLMAQNDDWPVISMAVLTADHRISPNSGFFETIGKALDTAETTGALVTIGIQPSRPETGYGYVEIGEPMGSAFRVRKFREKPDEATARAYLESGQFYWNSGMFFWTLPSFLKEMEEAQPEMASKTREIAGLLKQNKLDEAIQVFESLESISIDFALMENAKNVAVVRSQFVWDDLGSWDSLRRSFVPDGAGNINYGLSRIIDGHNNVIYNTSETQEVCLMGLEDLVVVVTDSKVMICPVSQAQQVKKFSQPK